MTVSQLGDSRPCFQGSGWRLDGDLPVPGVGLVLTSTTMGIGRAGTTALTLEEVFWGGRTHSKLQSSNMPLCGQ
jgi:hypothetical protein